MSISAPRGGSQTTPTHQRARQEEANAQRRIEAAREQVAKAQKEAESEISVIRERSQQQTLSETAKQEERVQRIREQGYENLNKVRQTQQQEIKRVRDGGEKKINELRQHYGQKAYETERKSQVQIQELIQNNQIAIKNERETSQSELKNLKETGQAELLHLQREIENQMDIMRQANNKRYEETLAAQKNFVKEREAHFNKENETLHAFHEERLNELFGRVTEQLQKIQDHKSKKLATYDQQGKDPFYSFVDLGTRLKENRDSYTLSARIPKHEQANIRILARENEIVLIGSRRNEEEKETETGRIKGVSSYQTYRERFPVAFPIDGSKLERSFQGDRLIVTIPKKGLWDQKAMAKNHRTEVENSDLMRPVFPRTLSIDA
jgi:HSP20 family molecular chaperone IbpA